LLATSVPPAARAQTLELALAELRKAEQRGEQSAMLFDDLGSVLEMAKDPKAINQAIQAYARAAALAPQEGRAKVLTKRGWALVELKKYDEARADFAAATRPDPRNSETRLICADAYAAASPPVPSSSAIAATQKSTT
jgi:tetratricopeptide (TPR) repeat protein